MTGDPPDSGRDGSGRFEPFRRTAARFATGVTVVTTSADGEPFGMTVNAFMTLSLDPLLIAVGLSRNARAHDHVVGFGRFAVTVLGDGQAGVARWFADPKRPMGADAFSGAEWMPGPATGCPVLVDGVGYFDCTVDAAHPAGDHSLVIGRVEDFGRLSAGRPLLFMDSAFATAHPVLNPPGTLGVRS